MTDPDAPTPKPKAHGHPTLSQIPGAVATGVVDGLKVQPAILALCVLNIIVFGMVYYTSSSMRQQNAAMFDRLISLCAPPKTGG